MSLGTNFPSFYKFSIISASGPPAFFSSLNKSPVDKWRNWNSFTILSHWVPFPAPGPPNTKITYGLSVKTGAESWFGF